MVEETSYAGNGIVYEETDFADIQYEDIEQYEKAVGLLRLKLHQLMRPLEMYGQGPYVNMLKEEFLSLAVQMHLKLSGVDIPYEHRDIHLHW